MDDFISRRAAIDELGEEPEVWSGIVFLESAGGE